MMKKLVGVAIFAFWAVTASMLTAGLVFYQGSMTGNVAGGSSPGQQTGGNQTSSITIITLTAAEIAKHNSASDCWIIISSKVYDVTNYLNIHPGGPGQIIPYCGKDATDAFDTKNRNPSQPHSQTASGLLAAYYIGDLNQKVSQQNTQPSQNPPGSARISGGHELESD